jgi:Reverse transcriptase (RNA-dependent DNA polymerase).
VSSPILALGQILDDHPANIATLTSTQATITQGTNTIATGYRDHTTNGMWHIHTAPHHKLNTILHKKQPKTQLAIFLHATLFSPAPSTLIKAIKSGYLSTWPGLTPDLISKHLPPQIATMKGHLDQEAQGLQSTRPTPLDETSPADDWQIVTQRTNNVMIDTLQPTDKTYSDLTGRFPHISRSGYQYIFILYHYDTNAIIPFPMKDRTEAEHIKAWTHCYDYLKKRGHAPMLHVMDNETSQNLLNAIEKKRVNVQLVPPHVHRRNAAERAIRTFKNHFIAGLCSTNPQFPMNLWADLLPQAALTLNLLRPCRTNPKLSAHAALEGIFDYNKTPLAPPGTKVIVHQKANQRNTWSAHGIDGWYIGPALRHYQCVQCYVPTTNATRIADTVQFIPHYYHLPQDSPDQTLITAAQDLTSAMQEHTNKLAPRTERQQFTAALEKLTDIFTQIANKETTQDSSHTTTIPAPSPRVQNHPAPSPRTQPTTTRVNPSPSPDALAQSPPPETSRIRLTPPQEDQYEPSHSSHQPSKSYSPQDLRKPFRQAMPRRPLHTRNTRAATQFRLQHMNNVLDPNTGNQLEYRQLIAKNSPSRDIWLQSMGNEIGRLAQGIPGRVTGTNTIFFIPKSAVPPKRKVTYARIVPAIRPQKEETHRIRVTVGGNLLEYDADTGTPAADLTTTKLFLNSVISTESARFMNMDVKDFYLNNVMKIFEYMKIHLSQIPDDVIRQYNLREIADDNGFVCIEIRKGMYGLKQAGRIAYEALVAHLAKYGYSPSQTTQGLWTHATRSIQFILVVDDFGVKYTDEADVHHLIKALTDKYKISIDWNGQVYCGLHLHWNYTQNYVDVTMPQYIATALKKFHHTPPTRPQHAPAKWTRPNHTVRRETFLVHSGTSAKGF